MAEWHLVDLENQLNRYGWKIVSRDAPVNSKCWSATWRIERDRRFTLCFEGLDDMRTLPIEKVYACLVKDKGHSLYFCKKGKGWLKDLSEFVQKLTDLSD